MFLSFTINIMIDEGEEKKLVETYKATNKQLRKQL